MSPRYKKPRNCKCRFKGKAFKPTCIPMSEVEQIPLLREELEVLKLCDLDGLTQEAAGLRLGVSRGTVQRILSVARKKVATALSKGKAIVFESGSERIPRSLSRGSRAIRIKSTVFSIEAPCCLQQGASLTRSR